MKKASLPPETAADQLLKTLYALGVRCLFANAGTDFPSIVEGLAKASLQGEPTVRPIICPHENAAVSMSHGYTMVTGEPQAVMVHVNVGTANGIAGLMNAERERIPMLFMAGRTPILEQGVTGSRSLNIHWAQEMFDQGGLVREIVKWDYELRDARQTAMVVDRALAITRSDPKAPVYLTLPREVLAAEAPVSPALGTPTMAPAAASAPDPDAIAAAADFLARAERPLIVAASAGRNPATVPVLSDLAQRHALPVVEFRPRYLNLATDHPMHLGFEVAPHIADADAVLVLDCDVPWIPAQAAPPADCPIIQIGPDPLFQRYPTRGFPSTVTIAASTRATLVALDTALEERAGKSAAAKDRRRAKIEAIHQRQRTESAASVEAASGERPISFSWASHCVGEALPDDAIVVNEYPLIRPAMTFTRPGSFFGSSPVGGLGWGLPAALGAKLAAPDRFVMAALGDGSYLFANPAVCHQIAAAHDLPILIVVFNNEAWRAVERATKAMYPDGAAARSNIMPLVSLAPAPHYDKLVESCGGWGERVEDPAELPAALARAIKVVQEEQRQALLNVICR